MKYIIISVLCFLCWSSLFAQKDEDQVVFKAMADEIERSRKELAIPGARPAFFISYNGAWGTFINMRAIQGAVIETIVRDDYTQGGVQLFCGDYHNTNRITFKGRDYTGVRLIGEKDYDAIRYAYWMGTDAAYKQALQQMIIKKDAAGRLTLPEEEIALPEFEKITPVTKITEPAKPYEFDRVYWENYMKEVSAMFSEYKDIFNSGVYVHGVNLDVYTVTSEGTKMKEPLRYFTIRAGAMVRAADGMEYSDTFVETAGCPQEMPEIEKVKQQVRDLVERLRALAKAPVIEEEYTGPVMFEGETMQYFFVSNLYAQVGNPLHAFRSNEDGSATGAEKGEQIGEEVTNKCLTVKNYTNLKEYNGIPLMGSYEVDAEGVAPAGEMTLIEKGVLKHLLNNRVPTLKCPKSTGSCRNAMQAIPVVAPGVLHIQAEGGKSVADLKKQLLKTAKKKKLKHAYIVRKRMAPLPLVYRVDVKTGEETLVRSVTSFQENWNFMKKAIAFSKEELVLNCVPFGIPAALIYPSAVIIDGLHASKIRQAPVPEPALTRPALRQ